MGNRKYNWNDIQRDYDSGLSQPDIIKKYGMSSAALHKASKRGDFKPRTLIDGFKLWRESNPDKVGQPSTEAKKEIKRKKLSEIAKVGNYGGYKRGSGRGKKCWYESSIAGKVWCDSTYELVYAKRLDALGVKWRKNNFKFPYMFEGKRSNYIPDFYVHDWEKYIETKGYKTERDEAKWRYFPHTLVILYGKDLEGLPSGVVTRLESD